MCVCLVDTVTRSQLSWGIESFLDTTSRRSRCSLFAAAAGLLLLLVATSCGQRRFQPESLPVSQQMLSAVKSLRITIFAARCYACAVLAMVLCLSVCLCLCLFVTSQCSTKTAKRRITRTTPHDSPGNLVFLCQRYPRNSTGITPYGAPNAGGVGQNRRLSTNNRLYLENGKR